jgi:hypothetical protein
MEGCQLANAVSRYDSRSRQKPGKRMPSGDAQSRYQRLGDVVALGPFGICDPRAPIGPECID